MGTSSALVPNKSPYGVSPEMRAYLEREFQAVARALNALRDDFNATSILGFGVVAGDDDQTGAIQAALDSGATVVDFLGLPIKCDEIEVPAGVWAKNVNLTKYTNAAGNVVLINDRSRVTGKIAGTGLTSAVQRCIYPAANDIGDFELGVEVTNATYGVHLQPLSGTAVADRPKRGRGWINAHDIVGTAGETEGYGLLMSPAESCNFIVHAKDNARHDVYLGAGARFNRVVAHTSGCQNYAAQLYSLSSQDATELNDLTIFAHDLGENVAGQGGALAIVQKAHRNTVRVFLEGNGVTTYAILVAGESGGPYPTGNKIVDGAITGEFIGADVIRLLNDDSTLVRGMTIEAFATSDIIGMRRSGTNGAQHGAWVTDNVLDALGNVCKGIYDEVNAQPSYLGPNEIRNTGGATEVDDQSGGNAVIGV